MSRALDNAPQGKLSQPAFGGRLQAVSLFDAIQFLLLNRKTGTLTVRSGSLAAYLTFFEGQIMTALDDALHDGEPVVLRAVQWTEGTFEFAPGPVPPDRKIQLSTDNVLLEAARQIDEMRAADPQARGSGSLEADLVEKRKRADKLSEMFRSVMAGDATGSRPRGWRDEAVQALSRPDALRLLVGPGARVALVGLAGVREMPSVSASDTAAWIDELAPRPRGAKRDSMSLRRLPLPDESSLWVQRHTSPEGDWLSVSLAGRRLPEWSELGLPDPLYDELQSANRGITLVRCAGPVVAHSVGWPGLAALAAWLARRAAERAEVGWIVETMPRYDWSVLPGWFRSVAPSRLRKPGALEDLCRSSGAAVLALAEVADPMFSEALRLSEAGVRVVLLESEAGGESRLQAVNHSPAATWEVRSAPPPQLLPLTSRLLTPSGRS